ncbi:MAG: RNA 2',3'-cyclic phosphodiesterase [Deltaproteobacteria bacterium]|nr:RNA 2',3'-cyclic phosphodiesterase [Deltaproteobacteria bacterium]
MGIRSFLAFELSEDIKNEIARISSAIKKTGLDAGWVKPGNIHLTMVFMGDMEEKNIPAIIASIDDAIKNSAPFEISMSNMGLFPDAARPRVMWIGLDTDRERLSAFRDRLQKQLSRFGVAQEKRPFTPHLTLCRFRRPVKDFSLLKRVISQYSPVSGTRARLDELIFFKSDLRQGGPVYTKIHAWPLT